MDLAPQLVLVAVVAAVGVLHTLVPDHWMPIALMARQRGWSRAETMRAAAMAGTGHVLSTLAIGYLVWIAGVAVAGAYGRLVDTVSSLALVAFGTWIAWAAWRELHGHADGHGHSHVHGHGHSHDRPHGHNHGHDSHPHAGRSHVHAHRHGRGPAHVHWHDHAADTAHPVTAALAMEPPLHIHRHSTSARAALLLILGSSPMVEGIPAFFAAGKYGWRLITPMALAFAVTTIATYVLLCVAFSEGLSRIRLGPFERYGEVLSGALIALVGLAFGLLA